MNGRLFLIPTPLGGYPPNKVLPAPVLDLIPTIRLWFVEELRTARRFLSAAGWKGHVEDLELLEINEHTSREQIEAYALRLGTEDAGLISEAGLPAVADPGAQASGLNGQCFAFTGYLPVKAPARREAIAALEKTSARLSQSQIIIETPYRNDSLLADLIATCHPDTRLCIAAEITCPAQLIRTRSVAAWRQEVSRGFAIGKRPCVFVLLAK